MALAVFLQFFTRYVLNDSFAWTEEIATYCIVALVFLGSAMCVRLSRHIQVDFLYRYLPPGAGARARDRRSTSSASPSSPTRAVLVWQFMSVIAGEEMTTIELPKNLVYAASSSASSLMFAALRSRSRSPTGGAAIRCSSAPRPSTRPCAAEADAASCSAPSSP